MDYRFLGRTGLKVSEIAFGNWITHGWQITEDGAAACVRAALDEGITTFDTADVYAATQAEAVLGRALNGVRRESVELCTKVFWPVGKGANDRGLSRKHIMESINGSLRRLGTDYVDIYQAHRFDHHTPLEETLRAFDDIVRQGKALYVGVSEWRAPEIAAALKLADERGYDRIVSNQPQYSILHRVPEAEVAPLCQQEGLGQLVWSPLAQGVLSGKYQPGATLPPGSRASDRVGTVGMRHLLEQETLQRVQGLQPIASDLGMTMPQLAIAWVLQSSTVSAAIVGASSPDQVRDNVKASGVRLSRDVMDQIDAAVAGVVATDPDLTKSPAERP